MEGSNFIDQPATSVVGGRDGGSMERKEVVKEGEAGILQSGSVVLDPKLSQEKILMGPPGNPKPLQLSKSCLVAAASALTRAEV